jgi:hypothetical protein
MPQPFDVAIPCAGILHAEKGNLMPVLQPFINLVRPYSGPAISEGAPEAFIDELKDLHFPDLTPVERFSSPMEVS